MQIVLRAQYILSSMMNVLVRNADPMKLDVDNAQLLASFHDRGAESASQRAFFDRNDSSEWLAVPENQPVIERLDEARVDDSNIDFFSRQNLCRFNRWPDLVTDREDRSRF